MNSTILQDIADAVKNHTGWDDIATGLACVTFCAASASMFVVLFAGAV